MNRILSNVKYSIKNASNYDITYEETKDIIDIPYFPAQNLVDLSKTVSVFHPSPDITDYIPFIKQYVDPNTNQTVKEYIIYGLFNRKSARILFIKYEPNARKVVYKFKGVHYPQGRDSYALTYNGYDKLVIFGGYVDGRCVNDLWLYDFNENAWKLLNYSEIELSANEIPSHRRNSSIILFGDEIYIFGGETDTLISNTFIPLNDIWKYKISTGRFERLDKNGELPRRTGNIVYVDDNEIHIFIKGGVDDITGQTVPDRIYVFSKGLNQITDVIDITNPPFIPDPRHRTFMINGKGYLITFDYKLYEYDKLNKTFVLKNVSDTQELVAITGDGTYFVERKIVKKNAGNDSRLPLLDIVEFNLVRSSDPTISDVNYTIVPPPFMHIPHYAVAKDRYIVFIAGMLTETAMNEKVFIYDKETSNTEVLTFNVGEYPSERLYPALCYDEQRNCIWLFGGYDGTSYKNDLWKFDLNTKTWTKVHDTLNNINVEAPTYPQPRWKASITVVANWIYVSGGYSDTQSFADLWKYDINSGEWLREYTVDSIPFGTQYHLFTHKERLWLFNGDPSCVYRYFYSKKQFVKQGLKFHNISETLERLINAREFLQPPVMANKRGNRLFVYSPTVGTFMINLENFEIVDFSSLYDFKENAIFVDEVEGVVFTYDSKNAPYIANVYVNLSPLYPLMNNQIPSPYFYYDTTLNIRGHFATTVNEYGQSQTIFIDGSGRFIIDSELQISDKDGLYKSGQFSFVGLQSNYQDFNLDDKTVIDEFTLKKLNDYTVYTFYPRFLYNIYSSYRDIFTGSIGVFKRDKDGDEKVYIVYENGNIVRYNTRDETFFTYFTKLWRFCAYGYDKANDVLYVFGGIVKVSNGQIDENERTPYMQNGMAFVPIQVPCSELQSIEAYKYVVSHNGFFMIDFALNEFSLRGILNYVQKYNISVVDYEYVKDYLLDYINDYIQAYGRSPSVYDIERIQQGLYLNTQSLIDDLSQITVMYENGERPHGRAMPIFVSSDSGLFIFGGAEVVYTDDCLMCEALFPIGECVPIGTHSIGDNTVVQDITKSAYYFSYETRTWRRLSNLPFWLYAGSAIMTPDKTKIIIVGGATDVNLQNPSRKILIYDIAKDTYEELKGIPDSYEGRLYPALHWLDDTKLLIMYGVKAFIKKVECGGSEAKEYVFIPIRDAWIVDFENEIMYKAFDEIDSAYGITVDDYSFDIDSQLRRLYILNPFPLTVEGEIPKIKLYEYDLKTGDVRYIKILPDTEILSDANFMNITQVGDAELALYSETEKEKEPLKSIVDALIKRKINFRFRYAWIERDFATGKRFLFIIGERAEQSGIDFIIKMSKGYEEAHLRIWYAVIDDEQPIMRQIVYEYPLPISPKAVIYDGFRYVYFIYNRNNIWRLDFKGVLQNKEENHWYRLPPCVNCDFLGDTNEDTFLYAYILPPRYIVIVSSDGTIAKFDTEKYAWFVEKKLLPQDAYKLIDEENEKVLALPAYDRLNNELYFVRLGDIWGKYINLYYMQYDNFYFDLRYFKKTTEYIGEFIDKGLYPINIKRSRLYTFNHLGHIYYSWIRIDGYFDVTFITDEFYKTDEIRVYGDVELVSQSDRVKVMVFEMNDGWIELDTNPNVVKETVIKEPDWIWESDYTRRYYRLIVSPTGDVVKAVTKVPDNYIKYDIRSLANRNISRIRVIIDPKDKDVNYVMHLNKIDSYSDTSNIFITRTESDTTPLEILHIQPLNADIKETPTYIAYIRNNAQSAVRNVQLYVVDNVDILLSKDGNAFDYHDQNNPLLVIDEIPAGGVVPFYFKVVNVFKQPIERYLVVKGIYD